MLNNNRGRMRWLVYATVLVHDIIPSNVASIYFGKVCILASFFELVT